MTQISLLAAERLNPARRHAAEFVRLAEVREGDFVLVHSGNPGLFPRAIAVFAATLLGCVDELRADRGLLAVKLRADLRSYFRQRRVADIIADKPLMQALAFTLSALAALGRLDEDPLEDLVRPLLPINVGSALEAVGALRGRPQSGNLAMCLAVALIHARQFFDLDTAAALQTWVELHLAHMNRFGFWGREQGMTHLQFQNGYHQYEIFEYLRVSNPKLLAAKHAVAALADSSGQFAPYPGGGSCFDYDAVFVLTAGDNVPAGTHMLLETTAGSILREQGGDGGFCESRHVRPRTIASAQRFGRKVVSAWNRPSLFVERLRYALTLQRPKHDEIHTHWAEEGRRWDESNLWDTWFRMLALARIDVALNGDKALPWGFLPYPGLGYHARSVAQIA